MSLTPKVTNAPDSQALTAKQVAVAPVDEVLRWLESSAAGLSSAEASARQLRYGPNAVRSHHVNALAVLGRQLRNAVLILLAGTAVVSFFLGDSMQAVIIGVILAASIGLGFFNEYRAEHAAAELHAEMRHKALVRHDGEFVTVDVTALVPEDVIRLSLGEAVPADVRLIDVSGLECDEGILTGESTGSEKSPKKVESLATQTLIIFVIRTRKVPFFRSRPSTLLAITSLTVVAVGVVLTISPLAHTLGFTPLPWPFFAVLGAFVVTYLVLVELAKMMFYAEPIHLVGQPHRTRGRAHRIRRRAARFHYVNGIPPRIRGTRT